ncbi:MAG: PilN domain-containing protein [Deltaproteobacteria bacterium]|nr:PilN domain-containing protein [Deltaproteobacteria bacterium]
MGLLGNRELVGVEITPGELRLVEVRAGTPPQLTNFARVPHRGGSLDALLPSAAQILKAFTARSAAVAAERQADHHVLVLPPLSRRELRVVAARELRREGYAPPPGAHVEVGVLGPAEESEGVKQEVLAVMVAEAEIMEKVEFLNRLRLRPVAVLTPPLALRNLVMTHPKWAGESVAFAKLDPPQGLIAVFGFGGWRFARTFPLVEEGGGGGLDLETLLVELRRTQLYLRQQYRGEQFTRVVLCGGAMASPLLAGSLQQELDLAIELFSVEDMLDVTPVATRAAEFRDQQQALAVPLGLALTQVRNLPVNLLPPALLQTQRLQQVRLVGGAVAVGACLLLGGLALTELQRARGLQAQLRVQRETLRGVQAQLGQARQVDTARQAYAARTALRETATGAGAYWSELLRELSWLVPERIALRSLTATRGTKGWELKIEGVVQGPDPAIALRAVNEFASRLEASPFFLKPQVQPPAIGPRTVEPPAEKGKAAAGSQPDAAADALPFSVTAGLR